MAANQTWQPLERDALAARLARDIPEGWSVNLGIGIPTLVGNYVPPEREVVFHSENDILGMGPAPPPDKINRWLINASSQYVTLRPGASFMSHSDSFALVRGGHLDLCVLGAFQVAENGDLANWARSEDDTATANRKSGISTLRKWKRSTDKTAPSATPTESTARPYPQIGERRFGNREFPSATPLLSGCRLSDCFDPLSGRPILSFTSRVPPLVLRGSGIFRAE